MAGANINRRTLDNVRAAVFDSICVARHVLGIVRVIEARKTA
jgi:hypothetical protein